MKRRNLATVEFTEEKGIHLSFASKRAFLGDLAEFPVGNRVWVSIETYYRQRTTTQNSVMHWYIDEIAKETGMEPEEVKEQMARKFLTVQVVDKNDNYLADPETGEVYMRVMSTTELTTVTMMEYLDKIRLWALSYLNMDLPLPDPEKKRNEKIKF